MTTAKHLFTICTIPICILVFGNCDVEGSAAVAKQRQKPGVRSHRTHRLTTQESKPGIPEDNPSYMTESPDASAGPFLPRETETENAEFTKPSKTEVIYDEDPNEPAQAPGVLESSPPRLKKKTKKTRPKPASNLPADQQLAQAWASLSKSSRAWLNVDDESIKKQVVSKYIELYGKKGINISKSAEHYVSLIDEILQAKPELASKPFVQLFQYITIIEYDFGSGQDKNILAKNLLGEEGYEENKKRLGLK